MDVLLTQTFAPGAAAAADDLRRRGHHVEVCHPDGQAACVALNGGTCPLDRGTVDAMVVIRSSAGADTKAFERGGYCAAQRGVPLVVGGDPTDNPFGPWTSAEEEGSDVARTVETVVALPVPALSVIGTRALHDGMRDSGAPTNRSWVEVRRRHGGLVARLVGLEGLTSAQAAMASVRVAAALRAHDRWARRIDVTCSPETRRSV